MYYIPSPPSWSSVIEIGPFSIHVYALAILFGIALAVYFGDKRFYLRGGEKGTVLDTAIWIVPISVIGARLYHCISNWNQYFPPNGDFFSIFRIWEGGLAIIGGVSFGALSAYIFLKYFRNVRLGPFADSIAPYIALAQVFGRIGNYFNQELFGLPTTLPWGLKVDSAHTPSEYPYGTLFHPTFLYEQILNLIAFSVLLFIDKKKQLRSGQLFCLYMIFYGCIRFVLEFIRIDKAYVLLGIRFNGWAALIVVIVGIVAYIYCGRRAKTTFYSKEEQSAFILYDEKNRESLIDVASVTNIHKNDSKD
ncbi:prolipoprotein diacylglyceryl transferase [Actinomyces sp. zg-332]|uniref:prolipoprotein diacylglyceryl transferase n=1 Tax=Actinomyces sp. zg-332 TaxID=2708340 RepID=UPI001422FD5B|nr:prolipoprotein diacylglyceryl transferase [Actinomyces sp. zg-332]QPK93694.1 prolipoprotein diacylglyceryl transferase [Actinomyces sp. zg-332]